MSRTQSSARALLLAVACLVAVALPRAVRAQGNAPTIAAISELLGVTPQSHHGDALQLGESFTAILADSAKLAKIGIRGMHRGARVTIFRVAPDRIRVEADELEPKPASAGVTLRLDAKGSVVTAAG